MAIFPSRFPGKCEICARAYAQGDQVFWVRGMKSAQHALCSDEGRTLNAAVQQSKATDADVEIPVPKGLSYLHYQKAGIKFMMSRKGTLLGDEMGLGKTIQTIGVINSRPDIENVIIVAPKSLGVNWGRELGKWLVRDLTIGVATPKECPNTNIVIINYDALKRHIVDLTKRNWHALFIDEAHLIKNPETIRSKSVRKIAKKSDMIIAMTGSPIPNRPKELWPLLQLVNPEHWDPAGKVKKGNKFVEVGPGEGSGFFRFAKKYCDAKRGMFGYDFSGASNLDQLHDELRMSCMIRRLKADVLKDLPAKRRQMIELLNNSESLNLNTDFERVYGEVEQLESEALVAELGNDPNAFDVVARKLASAKTIAFTELAAARHKLGLAKVEPALEHIREMLDSVGKIVIFAHHSDVIDALHEGLRDYGVVVITGATKIEDRTSNVDKFQTDPSCRVFIGSVLSTGVGLTLTAASVAIMVERDWVPSNVTQAEDRIHRIGQNDSVLIQHLVFQDSIDARQTYILLEKQAIIENALDRNFDLSTIERQIEDKKTNKNSKTIVVENKFSAIEIADILKKLKFLADRCDGASTEDGCGFNKFDSFVGKQFAAQKSLSQRQAAYAAKLITKYRRQLTHLV